MRTITCETCGVSVETSTHNRRFCSPCLRERRLAYNRRRAAAAFTPMARVDLICETCGTVWHTRTHKGRWCRPCREVRARQQTARAKKARRAEETTAEREARLRDERVTANRRRATLKRHDLTEEDYRALYSAQGGHCAICQKEEPVLCVDHCHRTLRVRGLLCRACNRSIGQLGDTYAALRRAADYLEAAESDLAPPE